MGKSDCQLPAPVFGEFNFDDIVVLQVKCTNPHARIFSDVGAGCCRTATGSSGDYTIFKKTTFAECKALCEVQTSECVGLEHSKTGNCEIHRAPLVKTVTCPKSKCLRFETPLTDHAETASFGAHTDFHPCTAATVPVLDREAGFQTTSNL